MLDVVRRNRCRTVVVEERYIDADYRSEFASFWSKRFDVPSPFTRRVHFFRADVRDDQLSRLPSNVVTSYLGYCVLRPGPHRDGRVGRTVLTPPPRLRKATLTAIEDRTTLFGNKLKVKGVPFIEQDGEFLRCAHAAIWGCHYSAFKRGLVGRRLTAELVDATPTVLSADRALPSRGMVLEQIQAVFAETGQPALRYMLGQLPTVLGVEEPTPLFDKGVRLPAGSWDIRLFSVICRYLNSGFPVMVTSASHGWNLVGWFLQDQKIKFVACDDQVGPYEVIDSPFGDPHRSPWRSIMVPLPPKVYMSGEMAENWGHLFLRSFGLRAGAAASWRGLADALATIPKKGVSLRTFLRDSSDYKEMLLSQGRPDPVVESLRLARFPHYVWIVEAHDRSLRRKGKPSVLAEVILDPHSSDHVHRQPQMDSISLPGLTVVRPPEEGSPVPTETAEVPWRSQLL